MISGSGNWPEQSFLDDDEDGGDLKGVVVGVEGVAQPRSGQTGCVNPMIKLFKDKAGNT